MDERGRPVKEKKKHNERWWVEGKKSKNEYRMIKRDIRRKRRGRR